MTAKRVMRIGEVYRYARPYNSSDEMIDGMTNYFWMTQTPEARLALLDSGINPIVETRARDGRTPAILIASSPHKIGSAQTPWFPYRFP